MHKFPCRKLHPHWHGFSVPPHTSRNSNLNDRKPKVVNLPPHTLDSVRYYTPETWYILYCFDYLSSKVLFDALPSIHWLWLWLKCDCSDLGTKNPDSVLLGLVVLETKSPVNIRYSDPFRVQEIALSSFLPSSIVGASNRFVI